MYKYFETYHLARAYMKQAGLSGVPKKRPVWLCLEWVQVWSVEIQDVTQ